MSILLHVTLRRNLPSIMARGIDPAFSQGQLPVCWFVPRCRREWAVAHVADRHGVSPAEVAVIRVSIPRSQLQHMGLVLCLPPSGPLHRLRVAPLRRGLSLALAPPPACRRRRAGRFICSSERMKR